MKNSTAILLGFGMISIAILLTSNHNAYFFAAANASSSDCATENYVYYIMGELNRNLTKQLNACDVNPTVGGSFELSCNSSY